MRTAPLLALLALAAALVAPRAGAQCTGTPGTDYQVVTARQINALPQSNVDFLTANAATLTAAQIAENVNTSPFLNQQVQMTGVVLTDPLSSGNATPVGTPPIPGRVHMFVRDVAALTDGNAGMGMQIVDARGDGSILTLAPGDEIVICGIVAPFVSGGGNGPGVTMQLAPNSLTVIGSYPASSPLRQPVAVTVGDVHNLVGGGSQIDWSRYGEFNSQFVRLEAATLVQGVPAPTGRPDMLFESAENGAQINSGTLSLRFRNDRAATYPNPPYNTRPADDPFTPPATGTVNIQGYLTFSGYDGPTDYAVPANANWVINPFADSDFEIAVAPPIVSVPPITAAPGSGSPVSVTATVEAGTAGNTIASVVLAYQIVGGAGGTVTMTSNGDGTYTGQIPGAPNMAFVTYSITATDNQGAASTTAQASYRVLDGPITSLALVQTTFDGNPGPSPFYFGTGNSPGPAVAFNLTATVQTIINSGTSFYAILQDDASLQPWTGIWGFFGSTAPAFAVGDRLAITEAAINERFDVTQLQNVVFTVASSGSPLPYKTFTTDLVAGAAGRATAEAHEGMLLRFDNVTITDANADGPDEPGGTPNFGEWAFSSDGNAATALRADDFSNDIPNDFNVTNFEVGQGRQFMQGAMYFAFGNYKIVPTSPADIGGITSASEAGAEGGTARITGTFPNPTTGTARVRFELDRPGTARLALVDALGREVAVLADGAFGADVYDVALDARGLAAGVYTLRLTTADAVATTRLSVVR